MTPGPLSPSGEEAWRSLSQHAEWATGSWIGWIFTDAIASGFALHQRLARQLALVGRRSAWWLPRDAEQVEAALRWLLSGADSADGCVWLAWPEGTGRWAESWSELLNRLNERREVLRRALRGGLVFVVPLALKEATRSGAPDLWSIRSFALDVRGVPGEELPLPPRAGVGPAQPGVEGYQAVGRDLVLAEQAVAIARAGGNPEAEVRALNQLALALLRMDRPANAGQVIDRALVIAEEGDLRAEALLIAGLVLKARGDQQRSVELWRESWAMAGPEARSALVRTLVPELRLARAWGDLKVVARDALGLPRASSDLWFFWAEACYAEGRGDFELALENYERFSSSPRSGDDLLSTAEAWESALLLAHARIAEIQARRGDIAGVLATLRRNADRLRARHLLTPNEGWVVSALVYGLMPLAAALRVEQRHEEAQRVLRESLALAQERPGLRVVPASLRDESAQTLDELAALSDSPDDAAALRAEAAALRAS